jgi:hypothetical protein
VRGAIAVIFVVVGLAIAEGGHGHDTCRAEVRVSC